MPRNQTIHLEDLTPPPTLPSATALKPLGVTTEQAALMIGSPRLFERMIQKKWITPVISQHRLRLWDREDVERCWGRLRTGESLN